MQAGARLVLTYPSERLEENVRELAAKLQNPVVLPCDVVERRADRRRWPGRSTSECGGLDFLVHGAAFAPQAELSNPFVADLPRGLPHRARHQRVLAHRPHARGAAAHGTTRRRQRADADVRRQRPRVSELQRDGRGQGGARVVGPLPGGRSRAAEHPRQCDFGRTDQDAGGRRHLRLLEHPAGLSRARAASAQRRSSPRSPTRRCSCSVRPRAPSPAKC